MSISTLTKPTNGSTKATGCTRCTSSYTSHHHGAQPPPQQVPSNASVTISTTTTVNHPNNGTTNGTTTSTGNHPNSAITAATSNTTLIRILILCILLINSAIFSIYGTSLITTTTTISSSIYTSAAASTTGSTTSSSSIVVVDVDDTVTNMLLLQRHIHNINAPMDTSATDTTGSTASMRRRVTTTSETTAATDPSSRSVSLSHPRPHQRSGRRSILVTGGAGFVGSHVVEYLLTTTALNDENKIYDDIIIIDEVNDYYDTAIKESNLQHLMNVSLLSKASSQEQQQLPLLHVYRGDITNTTLLDRIFTSHPNIISICHMAARAGVRPSIDNPYIYIHSNVIGTLTLLQYSVRYQVQNFVFASSSSVYGGSTSTYFTEAEPVDHPISPYAATKKACELFAYTYAYQHHLNITALRFFTVYGPRGRPDMAPYKFIHAISQNIPIQKYGDGTSSRDYTYISDIVNGVTSSLLHYPSAYSIYNLGKGNGTTLNEFVHYVEEYVNTTAKIQYLPDQPGDVPYTCANITRAQIDLHYIPAVSFPIGIQKTVQWYQSQQQKRRSSSEVSSSSAAAGNIDEVIRKRNRRRLLQQQQAPAMTEIIQFDDEMMDVTLPPAEPATLKNRRNHRRRLEEKKTTVGYKKIVVSGGISSNSFVGSHTIDALLLNGNDVVVVDDNDDISTKSTQYTSTLSYLQDRYDPNTKLDETVGQLSIYLGSRSNSTFLEYVFHHEQPTHVIHFGMDKYNPLAELSSETIDELELAKMYVQKNVEVLVRLLEVCKHGSKMTTTDTDANQEEAQNKELILNHDIQNFILTSSDAVYGYEAASTKQGYDATAADSLIDQSTNIKKIPHILRNEFDRVDYPKSSYGASMKSAELLGYTYHHLYHIPISILRLFNVYGSRQPTTSPAFHLFETLVQAAAETAKSNTPTFTKPGNQFDTFDFSTMDYTYIDDVVDGIVASIDQPHEYEIFNLGSGNHHNCKDGRGFTDLIRTTATYLSLPEEITKNMLKVFRKSFALQSDSLVDGISCANVQKARDKLQYNPADTMDLQSDFIQQTVEWHQKQQRSNSLSSLVKREGYATLVKEDTTHLRKGISDPNDTWNVAAGGSQEITVTSNQNTTGKLCPTEVIVLLTNNTNYPSWLRQLALTQWFIMVLLITFRICCRFRGGGTSNNHHMSSGGSSNSNLKLTTSSPTLNSLQQQIPKEGQRTSPKRDQT